MEDRERRVPDAEGTEDVEGHRLEPGRQEAGIDEERSGEDPDVEGHRLEPGRTEAGRNEPGRTEAGRNEPGRTEI